MFSETGLYHIVFRGVNHCQLFEEQSDYEKFLVLLDRTKTELGFEIYAYALMSNHVHLLIKENTTGHIVTAMRKTLTPYAIWFNKKYGRSGALIANRYKSEPVTTDAYLLALVRYIHRNPLEAGLVTKLDAYRWSSYCDYIIGRSVFVDIDLVLGMLCPNRAEATTQFIKLHVNTTTEPGIGLVDSARRKDDQVRGDLATHYVGLTPNAVNGLPKLERNAVLAFLRGRGYSIRQIERVTGVPRGIVSRVPPET
ncbi:MAG: transposase [Propionibacteriaceae bacterium]|jgi:REP element-mobilizing transposase RayT|nr:transposase [Propionibacteriaceae bacterium]